MSNNHTIDFSGQTRNHFGYPKYLWFLTLCFTMTLVLTNWYGLRLIHIFGLNTAAGTLIFPLTFLLSDLITEVYGFKLARRTIWCGCLFNILFILFGQLVVHLPSPDFATQNAMFDSLHAINARIFIASMIAYFCAEPLNSILMAKSKIILNGRYIAGRLFICAAFASIIDSIIFTGIAFYGTMSDPNLITMIFTMAFIKIVIVMMGLPITLRLTQKLKKLEQLDIYDRRTKFYMLCLDTSYLSQDNEFLKNNLAKVA